MTGVFPDRDEILQVAMIKMQLEGDQYVEVGQPLVIYVHNDKQPYNDFHRQFLSHIFEACNASTTEITEVKDMIHSWLGPDWIGVSTPCGDCVPCDIDFLYTYRCLDRPGFTDEGEPILGTFHFEYFDLNSVKAITRHKMGKKEVPKDMDENIHDGLVDCQNQMKELNFYLRKLL